MLCSKCSSTIRPVVAVDIDGTLGDYHGHFIDFAEDYTGINIKRDDYDGSINFGDWICETFQIDRRGYRDIKLAYRQGAQKRSMPIYKHARGLSLGVRGAGAELWLTTSRPYLRLDNVDPDTRAWLDRFGIRYDRLLYDEDKYGELAKQVDPARVAGVLEDLPEMYDRAHELFGPVVILRKTQYNIAIHRDLMVGELDSARIMLTGHVANWKIEHHFDELPTH